MGTEETVAGQLARLLPTFGVTHVFELVGGMVTVLLDSMHQNPGLRVVSMHHEQGAGFAAEGAARLTGRPSVALATSGPGATNLLTAVGSCYFDSVPVVFITGQVNRDELRRSWGGRQGGFQETDIVAMARPVTKWAKLVDDPGDFHDDLLLAFSIALEARRGPVLLDIPMDVQRAVVPDRHAVRTIEPSAGASTNATDDARDEFIRRLNLAAQSARKPLIIAGGGLRSAGAVDEFRRAVDHWGVPVVTSLMGIDSIPSESDEHVGMLGSYGNRWANWAVAESDLLIVLGSRLDVRQTGSDLVGFRSGRVIFHVDVDEHELNHRVTECDALEDDLARWIPAAREALLFDSVRLAAWRSEIETRREQWPDVEENAPLEGVNPNILMRHLSEVLPDDGVFVTDVGQHQMWAAQSLVLGEGGRFITSGGMGSMGFGLPASIGAALSGSNRQVCLIAGDGGFQCNIQELQTVARLGLSILMVILDNGCHGMVRQFQESYFDSRYYSTKWGYSAPNFVDVARAYGIPAWSVQDHADLAVALGEFLQGTGPGLIHVKVNEDLNVYPKMAFGRPFGSMEPDITPLEMEGT